jgi:hypothetical protein
MQENRYSLVWAGTLKHYSKQDAKNYLIEITGV